MIKKRYLSHLLKWGFCWVQTTADCLLNWRKQTDGSFLHEFVSSLLQQFILFRNKHIIKFVSWSRIFISSARDSLIENVLPIWWCYGSYKSESLYGHNGSYPFFDYCLQWAILALLLWYNTNTSYVDNSHCLPVCKYIYFGTLPLFVPNTECILLSAGLKPHFVTSAKKTANRLLERVTLLPVINCRCSEWW